MCTLDSIVEKNKAVYFIYSIVDETGEVVEQVDSAIGYVHGAGGDIIEKLEIAMSGRKIGDKIKVDLTPEEGFGEIDSSLIFTDDINNVPQQFREIGAKVDMQNEEGETREFTVSSIKDGKLTVDGNHPLAGKNITFTITITEIRDADSLEIEAGKPEDSIPKVLH